MKTKHNILFVLLIIAFCNTGKTQNTFKSYYQEIKTYQDTMNAEFADSKRSPMVEDDIIHFKKLDFFAIDSNYKVNAILTFTPGEFPFPMKTTTARKPMYVKYGEVTFEIRGVKCKLNVYQNLDLIKKDEYKDYLFMPFTDLTNGFDSYGGGRFLDLKIPEGNTIIIDFNKIGH